jgi:ectoine hydroxylase-related dioxygenase (phytanoyl-CoA dioxygenase family)
MMTLTQEQIDRFRRDGYLYIGQVLTPDELEEARVAYHRIMDGEKKPDSFRDLGLEDQSIKGKASILQVLNAYALEDVFWRIESKPEVLDVVEGLIGTSNIRLYGDQALYKPPKHGSRVLWHQDNGYWQLDPPNVVTMWLALDDADDTNGCMRMIPGSHLKGLLSHVQSSEREELRGLEVDESQAVSVHVPAGHAMMHHCLTLHGTQGNYSDRPRRAIAITYIPADARQHGKPMTDNPLLRGEPLVGSEV